MHRDPPGEEHHEYEDQLSLIELSNGMGDPRQNPSEYVAPIPKFSRKGDWCTRRHMNLLLGCLLLSLYMGMKIDFDQVKWTVDEWESDLLGTRCDLNHTPPSLNSSSSFSGNGPYVSDPVPENYSFSEFEPLGGGRFSEYKDGDSPYNITDDMRMKSDLTARSRRGHIVNAMKHAWTNYKDHAFGKDELHPLSGKGTDNWGGMGTTLVDALDTLLIMGMNEDFNEGRDWVKNHLSHTLVGDVSTFETTIRSLGGLLSAYDLSHDIVFLKQAEHLAPRLLKAFQSPSGLPRGKINLSNGKSHNTGSGHSYILAEVASLQLEFRYMARATGKNDYAQKSENVFDILNRVMPRDGLMPLNLKEKGSGQVYFSNKILSFGSMGDSAYENMLKVWLQGDMKEKKYRDMWDKSINGMHHTLLQKSSPNGLTYIADSTNGKVGNKMGHLACFMGGALAMGAYTDPNGVSSPRAQRDLKTAKALTYSCYQMNARSATGLSPESVVFSGCNDFVISKSEPWNILRPETVESFYYLNKLTGDPIYREWGWEVFQSIEKYCKTKYGYASLKNVDLPSLQLDKMESFFLAETLKYLYLLFDPDSEIDILNKARLNSLYYFKIIRLEFIFISAVSSILQHVFNTEGHPTRKFETI